MVTQLKNLSGKRRVIATEGLPRPNGGDSCGAILAVGNHLDPKPPMLEGDENYRMNEKAYTIVPGRAVAAIINGWGQSPLLLVSVYLDTRDGQGPNNRATLLAVAALITELDIPWMCGGDFQCERE